MFRYWFLSIFLLASLSTPLLAQNLREHPAEIPILPKEMTYREYQMLMRDLNWKRILISATVPGFIHYYAQHKKAAYSIAGVRTLGMLTSTIGMFRQWKDTKNLNLMYGKATEKNLYIFMAGMILNAAGYAYDWAHGDWVIERERTLVQYKYGIKKGLTASSFDRTINPNGIFLTLNLTF